jgi:CubicO group peptidase (beta-lactamase class C family)
VRPVQRFGRSAADVVAMAKDPRFLSLVAPAGNTVSTANEMSRFYELLRREGELDGVRYFFEPATLHRALSERSRIEFDRGLRQPESPEQEGWPPGTSTPTSQTLCSVCNSVFPTGVLTYKGQAGNYVLCGHEDPRS